MLTWFENIKRGNTRRHSRILVVEDDLQWQMIISGLVMTVDHNARVYFAKSVSNAIGMLNSHNEFDLILADFILDDDSTGIDLWKSEKFKTARSKFILVTGKSPREIRDRIGTGTAVPTIHSKTSPVQDLKILLRQILSQRRNRSS